MSRSYLDPSPLPGPDQWPDEDLVGLTVGFDAPLVLRAYVNGMFPMPLSEELVDVLPPAEWIGWFSPVWRGVLPLDDLRVPRSLRKSARHFEVTVDRAFDRVLVACGDPGREGGWIDESIVAVYTELHRAGRAHSVEAWTADGRLAGGLYGVAYGGLFAGESMFHDPAVGRDASKVALMGLVAMLRAGGSVHRRLLDVQWRTEHLATLGVEEIHRETYLRRLHRALELPQPRWELPADWRTSCLPLA
ncbi:leucyl/phenylalanyl-tRNA--protein transferase [Raineyella antarctica]|uniref:Leucyl/phenylalanyl-tRNA--protein transferase n=1 Tax=Raineyella antarctica TaxID=1577474 RepID=A0A1G6GG44_9ACTN|nr:leucyl/phenylalanyl-tRNA--protein transferase [Raineyella antarctica]SDB80930.1 leucyl/phenylalanyl-tRNA--protein transferase [Raineyella antarctica]